MSCPYSIVEIFAGAGRVSDGFEALGMGAFRFDCRISKEHNVHTPAGLQIIGEACVKTVPRKGISMVEPTCGSWIWVNLANSLRMVVA